MNTHSGLHRFAGSLLILILILGLCSCGGSSAPTAAGKTAENAAASTKADSKVDEDLNKKFAEAVEEGNYAEAKKIYSEKLSGNTKKENAAVKYLLESLGRATDAYNSGEMSYDEAYDLISTVQRTELLGEQNLLAVDRAYSNLYMLKDSKDSFRKAEEYFADGEYTDAYYAYLCVIQDDSNCAQCPDKIAQCIQKLEDKLGEDVNTCTGKKDFSAALNAIHRCAADVGYTARMEQLIEEVHKQWYSSVKADVEAYVKAEDYEQAVTALNEALEGMDTESDSSKRLATLKENTLEDYLSLSLNKAEKAFGKKKDYEAAIKVLQTASLILGDNETLWKKAEWYGTYAPLLLTSLEPTKTARYITASSWYDTDVKEVAYTEGDVISPTGGSLNSEVSKSEDESYICYYLNSEYAKFWGTLYRPYESLSCETKWDSAGICKIYGDGVLLYKSPKFTQETYKPVDFKVDVTGVKELKIVMMGVWTESTGWPGMYSRLPKLCMGNMYIQK